MTELEEIAAAAEEVADQQKEVAQHARAMQRLRDRGWSWSAIMDRENAGGVLGLLRASRERLSQATSRFISGLMAGLRSEGESHRKIAHRIGVSHQRVAVVLSRHEGTAGAGE